MKKFVLCAAAAALLVPAAWAGPMKPGKWQITMETDMPGMSMKMPPMTFERCVTPEEAEKPQPPKGKRAEDCKIEDYKIEGNTVTWKVKCEKQNTTGAGKITYAAESYSGEVHMKMGEQSMTQKFTGKRIGDCSK